MHIELSKPCMLVNTKAIYIGREVHTTDDTGLSDLHSYTTLLLKVFKYHINRFIMLT